MDTLLWPQTFLELERDFKRIYSAKNQRCHEQTARLHAYRKRFKLGQRLDVCQNFLYENYRPDLSKSHKLQQRCSGTFIATKVDKDPTIRETLYRNHWVRYIYREESLPPMNENCIPMDRRHDDLSKLIVEQRILMSKNPEQPGMEDSFP